MGAVCDCDDNNPRSFFQGTLRYVDPNGLDSGDCTNKDNPCQTINFALFKANAGDTLVLAAATFHENGIILNKNVTIIGEGANRTIIDADNLDRVFLVQENTEAIICLVNMTNGSKALDGERGGGIFIPSSAKIKILTSTLSNNRSFIGGAISNQGELFLRFSELFDNQAELGGALYNDVGSATIDYVTFKNNQASFGGAIEQAAGQVIMSFSTLSNNQAIFGGAIENINGVMAIDQSTISNNQADFGAGIDNNSEGLSITNSNITNNTAGASGGGLQNTGAATITDTTIANNQPDNCFNESDLMSAIPACGL